MKQPVFWLLSLILILISQGCEKEKCFYRTGEHVQKVLSDDKYFTVLSYGMFDIELVQDTNYYVEGVGGANEIDKVEASIKNDTLSLYNYNSCFWMRNYVRPLVRLHFSDIKRINLYETSYVFSNDSITDNFTMTVQCLMADVNLVFNNTDFFFYVHHKTGGRYIFSGKTDNVFLDGYYCSVIDASELKTRKTLIKNHSIADFKVWATDELNAQIYDRGNIYYKGSPTVIIDTVKASGKLISID
jgi:hypothetical protein